MLQLVPFMSNQSCFKDYVNGEIRLEEKEPEMECFMCHYNAETQLRTEICSGCHNHSHSDYL